MFTFSRLVLLICLNVFLIPVIGLAKGSEGAAIWKTFAYGVNPKTGEFSTELSNLIGKTVRIPGFMIPMEEKGDKVYEFLLTPDRGSCIHVPPPPPHLIFYVVMPKNQPASFDWGPIWIEGTLQKAKKKSHISGEFMDGELDVDSVFMIDGNSVKPYVFSMPKN